MRASTTALAPAVRIGHADAAHDFVAQTEAGGAMQAGLCSKKQQTRYVEVRQEPGLEGRRRLKRRIHAKNEHAPQPPSKGI